MILENLMSLPAVSVRGCGCDSAKCALAFMNVSLYTVNGEGPLSLWKNYYQYRPRAGGRFLLGGL